MEIDNIGIICKRNHKVCDSGADISDHNATDDQHGHIVDLLCHQQDKSHGDHGTNKSCDDHCRGSHRDRSAEEKDHQQGDYQLGSRGDSKHKRSCDRVIEKCLQEKSGNGKCSSQDDNCQDSWKTDLPYDIIGSAVPLMSEYNIQDFAYGKVNASGIYVPDK